MGGTSACWVPFAPQSARSVRSSLADYLGTQHVGQGVIDDALVVASELVTNAIRHGRPTPDGTLGVTWHLDGTELELTVCDAGERSGRTIDARPPSRDATGGRGLAIVAALSSRWWVDDPPGTAVHARIPVR
ncbi:ATP-binding protein [Solicola sp. PLA-1-18]|uniref:ATP-binding protein n=1 Tax=Solicola sp. PLA-1-18 TaxID=3380532 RepID=UPI003B76A773